MKYIQEVDAVQYDGTNAKEIIGLINTFHPGIELKPDERNNVIFIGEWCIKKGDWLAFNSHKDGMSIPHSVFITLFRPLQ